MSNQGWECPKCSRVYSPITPMCMYCGNKTTILESVENKKYRNCNICGNELSEEEYAEYGNYCSECDDNDYKFLEMEDIL